MSIGGISYPGVLPSYGAQTVQPYDRLRDLPHLKALFDSGEPLTFDKIVGAVLEDFARAGQMTPAEDIYKDRYSTPSQPSLPTNPFGQDGVINQGAYKGIQLGNGSSTISGSGCALASMTMISNDLTGGKRTLVDANEDMKSAKNVFADGSSDMNIRAGGNALGLEAVGPRMQANDANVQAAAERMNRKNPPMRLIAGVDYKGDSRADHFIAIDGMENGRLQARDPAGGRRIEFERNGDRWVEVRQPGQSYKGYTMTDFQPFVAQGTLPNSVRPPIKA